MCKSNQKKLCGQKDCQICFQRSFASCDKNKVECWSNKNILKPIEVFKSSNEKFKFECNICLHEFEKILNDIKSGKGCPYCCNPPKKLCGLEKCLLCFNKTFASFYQKDKIKCWSKKNKLMPNEVFKSSDKKFKFDCNICSHEFESSLNNIINGSWCSYCCNQTLCGLEKCLLCFNKTFASFDKNKVECWSNKNDLMPSEVFKSSGEKFKFDCNICSHEFESILRDITKGIWCPYCCNPPKKICTCDICFHKTFASFEEKYKIECWSKKNKLMPNEVFKSSHKKIKFDCNICSHEFEKRLFDITNGGWCQFCKNKTELKLLDYLKKKYNIIFQKKFDWCVNPHTNRKLPFDFYIEELNLIIELDGGQHFKQVSNWDSPENIRIRDIYKMSKALEYGISIIRIFQEDVWKNYNNWQIELEKSIKYYEDPEIIYIGNNQKYELHKNDMKKLLESTEELHFEIKDISVIIEENMIKISLTY
jgi:hypothetical protein